MKTVVITGSTRGLGLEMAKCFRKTGWRLQNKFHVSAAEIDRWHKNNGWAGIGYHFVIRKDGTIERGRPMDMLGAHCYEHNWHTVGVNIVGAFDDNEPEPEQMQSAAKLLAALCRYYGIAPDRRHIVGHRDYNATACPGQLLYDKLPRLVTMTRKYY